MNEVSCKVFGLLLAPISAKGVTLDDIVRGTKVEPRTLQDKKGRIDWSDYVGIMRNLRPHFSDEEYVEIGRAYMRSPGLRFAFVVARMLFSPMDLYRWFSKPKQGVGNQMFTCIVPNHREIGPNEIELELTLPDGHEVCWEFYVISIGNFEEIPRLFGLPRAKVKLERLPHGGRFRIVVPERKGLLSRLWSAITWPFTARAAARELKEAHETLVDRVREIEDARSKLDRQAAQLRIANSVNVLVQRDVDVDSTLDTIAKALVDEAGFAWAKISMVAGTAEYGQATETAGIDRVLEARGGERVGQLSVVEKVGANRDEHEELLSFITPSLAIALQNAIYRDELERRVDERTRELRQARDALAGTVEQLREAQGARERFFGNISHEIRTPLAIVLLAVGDIERRAGDRLDTRARGSLGSINDAVRKLVRLVDELLLLAAGQEGKLVVQAEPTNLVALIENIARAWVPAAEAAGLTLSVRSVPPIVANVDPVAMERAVTNLVSNAVKYTPAGGIVELSLAHDAEYVRISVLDTGPGISEDLAPRLFGRFERGDQHRHTVSGTGIGLAIVKQLVDAHGGTVAAKARSSGGTEMRIELPGSLATSEPEAAGGRRTITDPPPIAGASAPAQLAVPNALAKGSILIAEDDRRLADMLAELLSDEFVVRVANDGATALELAKRHQPQLLITDIDMPGINGIELSARFREVINDRLAPVVILSAVLDLGTRVAALEAGAVDYVTKPFDPSELRARVRAQFRMRDLAIRLHRAEQLSTLGVLTSGLAHELRNPANGVVNAVEPLKLLLPPDLVRPDHPVGQLLDVIGECAEQINTLSRQLLGFKSSATELAMRTIRLQDLVQRALAISQEAFKDVTVKVRVPGDLMFDCAPPLLVQVLTNLLENAAHAAGRGGWVDVVARVSGELVSLEVSDSGPGVPHGLRTKVFEPFFTTKPAGTGSGLGLAVSREIVARHGGSIAIEDLGERSAFVVRLPVRAARAEQTRAS